MCGNTYTAIGHSLLVLAKFVLQTLNLCTKDTILMLILFLGFAKDFYLGLKVFQVLLFAFSESTLSSSVLSLAFLFAHISPVTLEQRARVDLQ